MPTPRENNNRSDAARRRRPPPPRRPRVRYRWFLALLIVVAVVAFSIFLAQFILASASDLFGLQQRDEDFDIVIPENADISLVTGILSDAGVISQPLTFQLYANFKFSDDDTIHAGEYVFNSNMGYDQIFALLQSGNWRPQTVMLTFIEGMTLGEVADMLDENGVVARDVFIEYLNTAELEYSFMESIPDNPLRFHRLEGYIFPDTYEFYVPERVASVAKKFFDNFDRRISADMYRRMEALDMTLDEVITLASIIQKEAGHPGHKRRVSSVFHNRLGNPGVFPSLESDVTINYVENDIRPFIEDQDIFDAYNTYVAAGLPVGPVSNPGLESITAAMYPSDTPYYFFLTDDAGEFYYAENLTQHERNQRLAAEVNESLQE